VVRLWVREKTVSFGRFLWKGDPEEAKKPVPHWFHFGLQICVGVFALYWHWNLPAPNKAVLALASIAALMVLAEMRPIHKTIYFFLIVALVFTENRAIDKDRREFAENEALRRGQENAQFQKIADGLASSIQLSQQQFAQTKSGIEKSINTVTGGKTFCVVIVSPIENKFSFFISTIGKDPLHGLTVQLIDVDLMKKLVDGKPTVSLEEISRYMFDLPPIPFLASGAGRTVAVIPMDERDSSVVRSKPANGCGPGLGSFTPSSLDPASLFSFSSSVGRISGCDRGVAAGRAWR
jgi:hypothetical protein